jgi:hypothetical protein
MMKKLVFLMPLMFTLIAFSQNEKPITKGNIILSGGVAMKFVKTESTSVGSSTVSSFNLTLNPGISYFFIDNLTIGLNTDFTYASQDTKFYTLGVGPAIKYYFGNGIIIKAESTYAWLHELGRNDTYNIHYITFKPGVGYAFFINPKVSLEPSVNYEFRRYTEIMEGNDSKLKINSLLIEFSIVVFL